MNVIKALIEYGKLSSAHFAVLTATIPLTGAIAMGEKDIGTLTILFIIGFLVHIYGFAFNHYNDIEIDGLSKGIQSRPLVSGSITKKQASTFILLISISGLFITYYFFGLLLVLIYLLGIFLASLYDIFSKRITGMDFILAASVTTGFIFGASTVSFDYNYLVYILSILAFLQTINLNLIAGGIKDADHDQLFQSKHIAAQLGVKVEDSSLVIPSTFSYIAYFFSSLYAIVAIGSVLLGVIDIHILLLLLLVGINCAFFAITNKLLNVEQFDRQHIRFLIILHYSLNWMNVPILLTSEAPLAIFLILYPLIGLIVTNIIIHKTILRPQVL